MDYLSIVKQEQINEYTANLSYQTDFMGSKWFPKSKVSDPIVRMRRLVENGNLPVMAQVHSYDTEANIGDRTNYTEITMEALLVKEKLPITERIAKMLGRNPSNSDVIEFIFDDIDNLVARNLTRHEVMNMELLATGKVTVNENNVKTELDYKVPSGNFAPVSNWNVATHDILGDIEGIIDKAKMLGYTIVRALTSHKTITYLMKNDGIKSYWANSTTRMTEDAMLGWIKDTYGIEFITNDEYYKTSALATTGYRFYPEDNITWLTTDGVLGAGLYGVTPEQNAILKLDDVQEKMLVTVHRWSTDDPVETWTKASSVYLPVIKDINGLFITKINN